MTYRSSLFATPEQIHNFAFRSNQTMLPDYVFTICSFNSGRPLVVTASYDVALDWLQRSDAYADDVDNYRRGKIRESAIANLNEGNSVIIGNFRLYRTLGTNR